MKAGVQWALIAAFALGSAALGLWLRGEWDARNTPPPPPGLRVVAVGQPIGEWQGQTLEGGAAELPGAGRLRLVNFWASWCPPCVKELPAFQAFHANQAPNGVQVVGIALDDEAPAAAFSQRFALGFPQFVEANGPRDTSVRWGNTRGTLPFTVLIDADGRILATHARPFNDATEIADWVADHAPVMP